MTLTQHVPTRPGTPPAPRRSRRPRTPRGRWAAGVLLLAVALLASSPARALTAPGTDSTAARLAEWARGHGLSRVVDRLERVTYRAPAVGGAPDAGSPLAGGQSAGRLATAPGGPAAITPPASPALPGEGTWRVLSTVGGRPAVEQAFLRPDATHTGYTAGVAWMDPGLVRFVLHPGTQEPGHGPWSQGPAVSRGPGAGLLAAFNGGFRLDAARGGFYEDGRTVGALRDGAASLVIDGRGTAHVGQWGRDLQMTPDVVAVRQNLDLLVDDGQVAPGLTTDAAGRWGATLGNRYLVWRSGVGQTRTGALVYVAGDRLSAASLADLLQRAGAVRAMELDINPQWTSFVSYPAERNLLPDMQRAPQRYDAASTRDFVTVQSRRP